jgi:transposase InsO family protein
MYLATVIDLYSRRVIGYSMAEHMRQRRRRRAALRGRRAGWTGRRGDL